MVNYKNNQIKESLRNCIASADALFSNDKTIASRLVLLLVVGLIILFQLHSYSQNNTDTHIKHRASFNKEEIFSHSNLSARIKAAFSYVDSRQHITASSGGSGNESVFSYSLYYWGLFPLYPARENLPEEFSNDELFYSKKGADLIMTKYPNVLWMECWRSIANGDFGRHYLLYFDSLFQKGPKGVSFIIMNSLFFIVSLVSLFIVSWYYKKGLLGLLIIIFVGSYRFQIFEVYHSNNLFGYFITTAILITAIFFPILLNIRIEKWKQVTVCLLSGALFATFNYIRPECILMAFGVIFALLFYRWSKLSYKIVLISLFFIAFLCTETLYNYYFEYKFKQAYSIVAKKGGHVFDGRRMRHHPFWHSIWCGLGDFGDNHGYEWHDDAPKIFAEPLLVKKYGEKILKDTQLTSRSNNSFYTLPQYELILRDKIIEDIITDPAWYLRILLKRFLLVAIYVIAYKVHIFGFSISFLYLAIPCFLSSLLLLFSKGWEYIKLLIFSFPTAMVALFVYGGGGTPLYFVGHLYCLAISMYVLLKILLMRLSPSAAAKSQQVTAKMF